MVQPQVEVRACTAADASTLAVIGAATLLEAFAGFLPGDALLAHCRKNHVEDAYTTVLRQAESRAWLAEAAPGAAPVGYAMVTAPEFPEGIVRERDLELRRLYLFSRFHGSGVAQGLMDVVRASAQGSGAKRLLLGVHAGNHRALGFYWKNGFVEVGRRQFEVGGLVFDDPVLALKL